MLVSCSDELRTGPVLVLYAVCWGCVMDQLSLFEDMKPKKMEVLRKRSQVRPLDHAAAIWDVLSRLPIGSEVPFQVRILDYENGEIPVWIVKEREECGIVQILTVLDRATLATNWSGIEEGLAVEVFISPYKALIAPVYKWFPGCEKRRDKLGDFRQHARQMNDKNDQNDQNEEEWEA